MGPTSSPAAGAIRGALAAGLQRLAGLAGREPMLEDLALILTIPRTGTYTLVELVRGLGIRADVRGTSHQLCLRRPPEEWERDGRRRSVLAAAAWDRGRTNERWEAHRHLRRRAPAAGCDAPRKVHVIASTREPVSQRLSHAFFSASESPELTGVSSALGQLTDREPHRAGLLSGAHWWELDVWFDRHVKPNLGIDVFAEPFDRARGWQIYEGEDARLLLVRQESFDALPEAAGVFFGLRAGAVPDANAGEGHAYRGSYREARERVRVPASLLDTVYSARYASHFYTPDEIRAFKKRWSEPAP
ncbi:MAG TPA: putative capsular polysaccharide synthesis family protein [Longimicrobium sp.]